MANVCPGPIVRHLYRAVAEPATDAQLLERYLAGREPDAFAALVRRHGPMVWGVCRHLTRREHDAEDAFQAVFLLLARRAGGIKKRTAVASWLHGVAYRIATRANRRQEQRQARERQVARAEAVPAPDLAWRELQAHLDAALVGLPETCRAPFVLCCLEGRPRKDVAKELGVLEGTVSSRIARARALLQEALGKRGVTLSAALLAGDLWRRSASATVPPAVATAAVAAGTGGPVPAAVAALAHGMKEGVMGRVVTGVFVLLTGLSMAAVRYAPRENEARPEAARPVADAHGDPLPADALARLGTVRFRPGSHLKHLAFTPDGNRVVSSGNWCGVHVWDVATGRVVMKQPMPLERDISWARLAKDGKTIYTIEYENGNQWVDSSGNSNTEVRARRLTDLQEMTAGFNVGPFEVLGLSPDGKHLLGQVPSKDHPHALEIWDIKAGKKVRSWPAHEGRIRAWAFTADGTTLATGGDDKVVRFWDVATGAKAFEVDHPGVVGQLALSGDGKTLASIGITRTVHPNGTTSEVARQRIHLWDVPTRKERYQLDTPVRVVAGNDYWAVQFAPDGKTLASAGNDGVLRLWDVTTGKQVRQVAHGDMGQFAYAFSPDGKTLALGYNDIRVLNVADGKAVTRLEGGSRHPLRSAVLLRDHRTIATVGGRTILLWDRHTGRQLRRLAEHEKGLGELRVLPDGGTLVGSDLDGTILAWDSVTGRELRRLRPDIGNHPALVLSPDGKAVRVQWKAQSLHLMDWATDKEVGRITHERKGLRGMAYFANGRRLHTWGDDYRTTIWDLKTGKTIRTFEFMPDPVPPAAPDTVAVQMPHRHSGSYTAAVSPDGRLIAYGNDQGFLALHDTETGKAVRRVENLGSGPSRFAFSPDSRTLAWGAMNNDTAVHLLEVASGKERKQFAGHRGRIHSLEFTADGRTLVTASEDTTAIVWDVLGGAMAKEPLSAAELAECWADLTDVAAGKAFQAMRRLAAAPNAVAYLGKRLVPVPAVAEERLTKLIADLDSDTLAARERAGRELETLADVAAEACQKALANKPSAELRKRLTRLLASIDAQEEVLSTDRLRLVRAVEMLERFTSPDAAALLKALAGGAPGAFLTREATATLERSNGR